MGRQLMGGGGLGVMWAWVYWVKRSGQSGDVVMDDVIVFTRLDSALLVVVRLVW